MRSAHALVMMAGLTGCQLIFELEDDQVTGSFVYRVASTDPQETITVTEVGATDVAIQVLFDDDTVDVPVAEDGSFRFTKRENGYKLVTSVNLNFAELIETSDSLVLAIPQAGRPGAVPVTQPTPVLFPPSASSTRTLVTTGQWTSQSAVDGQVDWSQAVGIGAVPVGLIDTRQGDRVYLLDTGEGVFASGQFAIAAAGSADSLVMVDGTPFDLQGIAVDPATQNNCVTFGMGLAAEVDRLVAASPDFSLMNGTFSLYAAPSRATGAQARMRIVAGLVTDYGADFDVPAHDPFVNHVSIAEVQVLVRRVLAIPGSNATAAVFNGFTIQVDAERGDCPANRAAFEPQDVGYATAIALDGELLAADAQEIEIERPGGAVVTWTAEGRADFYDVTLVEMIPVGNELRPERRRLYRTHETRVEIGDAMLTPNHLYVIEIATQLGVPDAARGDYANFGSPTVQAGMASSLFIAK